MNVMKAVFNYFKKNKLIFIFTLVIIIVVAFLSLLPPRLLGIIVDDVIKQDRYDLLWIYASIYTSLYVFIGIVSFLKDVVLVKISQGITKKIRYAMLKHLNIISYEKLSQLTSGNMEANFNNDVDAINELITSGAVSIVIDLLKVIGISISIFLYSIYFGLIILGVIPLLILFTAFVRKRMFNSQFIARKLEGGVNSQILESVENIEAIKIYKASNYASKKYHSALLQHYHASMKSSIYDSLFSPVMQITQNIIIAAVVILVAKDNAIFGMSVGMVVSAIAYLKDLFSPIEAMGMEIQTIQKSMAGIKRINQFFNYETEENKKDIEYFDYEHIVIEFDNVTFYYENGVDVIKDYSLIIKDNDKIVLKGDSGAGKSTIFKLAYGLIKPKSGKITVNGIDAHLLSDKMKKRLFSIVYQNYFFSNGTIYEELTLLDNSISKEACYNTLALVGLKRIDNIEKKLILSDFSTGELALFNIARAVLRNAKVLFLDEMNAKIDPVTAKMILKVINEVSENKIVLSINHYGEYIKESRIENIIKL